MYSPEITAPLGSTLARRGSPRTQRQLQNPFSLPSRADPESSDAKILGPLSKRREVNLRWRFFEEEVKVQPPLRLPERCLSLYIVQQPCGDRQDRGDRRWRYGTTHTTACRISGNLRPRDLESIASPNPNVPKRATNPSLPNQTNNIPPPSTANRLIRRQHRKLLGKILILTYFKRPNNPVGRYQVFCRVWRTRTR